MEPTGLRQTAPEIMIAGREWRPRALLRAQLIEEGYDTMAVETWAEAARMLWRRWRPRLLILDLAGEPEPAAVLRELGHLMPSDRVIVLTGAGAASQEAVRALGFHRVIRRPFRIRDVVAQARRLLE